MYVVFFFFKQKTAYEMRISDWSSDVCSSDLRAARSRHLSRGALDVPRRMGSADLLLRAGRRHRVGRHRRHAPPAAGPRDRNRRPRPARARLRTRAKALALVSQRGDRVGLLVLRHRADLDDEVGDGQDEGLSPGELLLAELARRTEE